MKSITIGVAVDRAGKSHNCQANRRHRVNMGDVRLKVKNGRSWDHYCLNCAIKILMTDIKTLQAVLDEITSQGGVSRAE